MGCILGRPVEPQKLKWSEVLTRGCSSSSDGQPIILLNDRQTIEAIQSQSVLSVDLWKLGQCRPESQVRFEMTNLEAAQKIIKNAAASKNLYD